MELVYDQARNNSQTISIFTDDFFDNTTLGFPDSSPWIDGIGQGEVAGVKFSDSVHAGFTVPFADLMEAIENGDVSVAVM